MKKKQNKHFEDSVADLVQDIQKELTGPRARKLLKELAELLIKKQKDYGSRNILDCGELGVVVRCSDKIARLRNLFGITDGTLNKKATNNEAVDDSWMDLANYAIIALMVRRNAFDLPLKGEKK